MFPNTEGVQSFSATCTLSALSGIFIRLDREKGNEEYTGFSASSLYIVVEENDVPERLVIKE